MTAVNESLKAGPSFYDAFAHYNCLPDNQIYQDTTNLYIGHDNYGTLTFDGGKKYKIKNLVAAGTAFLQPKDPKNPAHPRLDCDTIIVIGGQITFHQIDVTASRVIQVTKEQFSMALEQLKETPVSLQQRNASISLPHPSTGFLHLTSDIHAKQLGGHTCLTFSVMMNDSDAVQLLLAAKADPEQENSHQETALRLAITKGSLDSTKSLVAARANLETTDHLQNTPLLTAVSYYQTDIAEYLLQAKANPHATNSLHDSALSIATESGASDIVQLLVTAGADLRSHRTSRDTMSAELMHAAVTGDVEKIKELIPAKYDLEAINYCSDTALTLAADNNQIDLVRHLLAQGANMEHGFHGTLSLAVERGYSDLIQLLSMANVNAAANLLIRAFELKNTKFIESFLEADRTFNENLISRAALINATIQNKIDVVQQILQKGVDATLPLECLLSQKHEKNADLLLTIAVQTNASTKPEMYASQAIKMGGCETAAELTHLLKQPKPTHLRTSSLKKEHSERAQKTVQWESHLAQPDSPCLELLVAAKTLDEACLALTQLTIHLIYLKRGFNASENKEFVEALRNPVIQSNAKNPQLLAIFANHRRVNKRLNQQG